MIHFKLKVRVTDQEYQSPFIDMFAVTFAALGGFKYLGLMEGIFYFKASEYIDAYFLDNRFQMYFKEIV